MTEIAEGIIKVAQKTMGAISSTMAASQAIAGRKQEFYVHSLKGSGSSASGFAGVSGTLIQNIAEIGSAEQDDNPMHAVAGQGGYFVVEDGFTRVGTFGFDNNGACVNHLKKKLMVYQLNEQGQKVDPKNPNTVITDTSTQTYMTNPNKYQIRLDAKATDQINFSFQIPEQGIATGSVFPTDINVYDSLGTLHGLRVSLKRAAVTPGAPQTITSPSGGTINSHVNTATAWYVTIAPTNGASGDVISAPYTGANGVLIEFDSSGKAIMFNNTATGGTLANGTNTAPNLQATWGNRAAASNIAFDLSQVFNRGRDPQMGNTTINGNSDGILQSLQWDENGKGTVIFNNGQQRAMFQMAIAGFNDENSLVYNSDGTYSPSAKSGEPRYGTPGDGRTATITPGAIEKSTGSTSEEQIKIMGVQRYQAGGAALLRAEQKMDEKLDHALG